jgi:plasmid stability protein
VVTLNIKNFPDELHAALAERAEQEGRSVAQEIIALLEEAVQERSSHSILEVAGLGADYWNATHATVHVDEERRAWDS